MMVFNEIPYSLYEERTNPKKYGHAMRCFRGHFWALGYFAIKENLQAKSLATGFGLILQ
jgi:hypothetical protein